MAPPTIDMTKSDAPALVNFPRQANANGHTGAHIKEFENPSAATNQIERSTDAITAAIENRIPVDAQKINALC